MSGAPVARARRRAVRCALLAVVGLAVGSAPAVAEDAVDWIHLDGYEGIGALAMRFTDLDLRDPHVFTLVPNSIGGAPLCRDFTDQPLLPPLVNVSFNGQIQASYTSDTSPADGFLDRSDLLLFRPLAQDGSPQRVESQAGQCTAPVAGTSCAPLPGSTPEPFIYASFDGGTCLAALPGTIGVPAYTPAIAAVGGPCFVTTPRTLVFDSGGTAIPLFGARIAGSWQGSPAGGIGTGLLRGFLRRSDADQITIPDPTGGPPIVLSSLLPGGSGNCSTRNDLDVLDGEAGWWFYFNYTATVVPYVGP